jgi:hypothetical protein
MNIILNSIAFAPLFKKSWNDKGGGGGALIFSNKLELLQSKNNE